MKKAPASQAGGHLLLYADGREVSIGGTLNGWGDACASNTCICSTVDPSKTPMSKSTSTGSSKIRSGPWDPPAVSYWRYIISPARDRILSVKTQSSTTIKSCRGEPFTKVHSTRLTLQSSMVTFQPVSFLRRTYIVHTSGVSSFLGMYARFILE